MKKVKLIVLITILLFIFLFIIPLIINSLYKYDFGIEIFRCKWDAGDALSFYGAVLGGFLTLVGVIATIKYERRIKDEEFELQYKPILKLEEMKLGNHESSNYEIDIYTNQCFSRLEFHRTCLCLKNIGRGEMLNVVFSNISMEVISSMRKEPFHINFVSLPECSQIPSGDNITFTLGFEKPTTYIIGEGELFNISFDIEYFGCLKTTKYKSNVSFCIEYIPARDNRLYNFKIEN